jgi:flagellar biosynthesis/type III secretory pathway protein FliH
MNRWWIAALLLLSLPLAAKELTPYRHGYEQGRQAGCREGRDRVGNGGCYEGENDGYAAGALYGQQQLVAAAWAQGLGLGQTEGTSQGRQEGRETGLEQGRQEGTAQGESKARASADQTAKATVSPRAEADGNARAALANPQADGLREGRQAGLERAKLEANEKDFARAREDYRNRQFGSVPKGRSQVRQSPLAVEQRSLWEYRTSMLFGRSGCPSPDWRYANYGSDNEEYQRGYRSGYSEGVRDGFSDGYDRQYRHAYDHAYALGVAQAQVVNLQDTVDQAYQEGFAQSHQAAFEQAQKVAHQEAFTPAFESAYSTTYAALYPQFEAEHYRSIEEATFQSVYGPPYQAAFSEFERASFDDNYPKQAKLAYDEGWKAEAKDFAERPVRLLEAWRTPTDVEGVQLLTVRLRNFSGQTVAGHRVRVSLGSQTSRLYHPLPPNSEMTVTGLLRLRGQQPEQAELFAVIESQGQRLPLGTVSVGAEPLRPQP